MYHSNSPPSHVIFPLSLHIIFPLYMSVSVSNFFLFYKDTSHTALWLNVCCHFSCIWLFLILWTIAGQAPLSMGFSRQEYWSGLLCLPLGDISNLWIKPAMAGKFFTTSTIWTEWPHLNLIICKDCLQIRYTSKVLKGLQNNLILSRPPFCVYTASKIILLWLPWWLHFIKHLQWLIHPRIKSKYLIVSCVTNNNVISVI